MVDKIFDLVSRLEYLQNSIWDIEAYAIKIKSLLKKQYSEIQGMRATIDLAVEKIGKLELEIHALRSEPEN